MLLILLVLVHEVVSMIVLPLINQIKVKLIIILFSEDILILT